MAIYPNDLSNKNISETFTNLLQTPTGSTDLNCYNLKGEFIYSLIIGNVVIGRYPTDDDGDYFRVLSSPTVVADGNGGSMSSSFTIDSSSNVTTYGTLTAGYAGSFGGNKPVTTMVTSSASEYTLSVGVGGGHDGVITGSNTNFGTPGDLQVGDAILFQSGGMVNKQQTTYITSISSSIAGVPLLTVSGTFNIADHHDGALEFKNSSDNDTGHFKIDSDLFTVKNGADVTRLKIDKTGNVKPYGTVLSGWHGCGLSGSIKLLPRDFVVDEKTSHPIFIETGSAGDITMRMFASQSMYATVPIPTGYTAISASIWGSDSSLHFEVYESNITGAKAFPKGQSTVNTKLNMTDVKSTSYNYLQVKVTVGANNDYIYGGEVVIRENNWGY